jgi:hypothetical protein
MGQGVIARYSHKKSMALSMSNLPERIRAALPLDWSVSFGTSANPVDLELSTRTANITSQLDPSNGQYMLPWQVHLTKASLRTGELGLPAAEVYKAVGGWDDYRCIPTPPMCAKEMPTFVEATTVKESQAMLRFGRDSNWPVKISVATKASPATMLAITYDTDWEGLTTTEEGEISTDWGWTKFHEKFQEEALTAPPTLMWGGGVWQAMVRKENNSIRIILKENGIWSPEDPDGPPPMILFGPKAIIKTRSTLKGAEAVSEMTQILGILYQNRYQIEVMLPSREWALIGSFGGGRIPIHYGLDLPEVPVETMVGANEAILDACLRTQNYNKGFDKFIRKFDRDQEMSAVVAIASGFQGDHGWAVAFKQGPRRCLLLDTTDGLSKDETLWLALSAWATFEPRHKNPRQFPGTLFYPDEASHIFEQCWDHLGDLSRAPGFAQCSPICQQAVRTFSEALSRYDCSSFESLPAADAPGKLAKIAQDAAISRVRPVADGPNQWEQCGQSTGTDGPSSQTGSVVGSESSPHSGLTDTCVPQGHPSYT